ncbi:hypothetical protein GPECTOR_1g17 [Gonium pectorale]|uniref:Uncharacterized protein n=1 Tax=Gonium pectorale TaxID=33097 RepID=A0A150H217_GONPE|nr:hypothetical protein GPECTOR_1g17 [Gonium pectorale]|eukprot:KXZ56196.1 hypothetical protein GPECTOR_1g17 [Gonium pectorale]
MGPNPGVDIRLGWEESEHKEFMKAIRAPLMVQTPLQLVIENLFQRVQAQATFIQQMRDKMDRIAVKDVTADELLDRIRLLEARQGESAGPKLDPFNQQEILARLEALESKATEAAQPKGAQSPSLEGIADIETRLQRLEKRMSGVYNLNGKLVAVETIAAGLGVAIPDLDYPTGGGPPTTPPQVAAAAPLAWRPPVATPPLERAAAAVGPAATPVAQPPGALAPSSSGTPVHPGAAAAQESGDASVSSRAVSQGGDELWAHGPKPHSAASHAASPSGDAGRTPSGHADASATSSAAPITSTSGTPAAAAPAAAPAAAVAAPASSIAATSTSGAPASHLPGLSSGMGGVSAQKLVALGQEVASLRSEKEVLREGLEQLKQQVAGLRSGLGANATESLSRLQHVEETVGSLQAQVADLAAARRDAAARVGSEVSFADFSLFKSQVEASVAEAKGHAAAATALAERDLPALAARLQEVADGVKKTGEPRDIDSLFHERINGLEAALGDLRTELRGNVEAALDGAAKLEELQALADAVEARAPAEAVRSLQQQTQALSAAVTSLSDTLALRPDLADSLRAAAGAAAAAGGSQPMGPLASKLRCLTCDQPVKQPISPGGGPEGGRSGRNFLPRLESLPGKEGLPGGPGVMVAELRASKEERLAGLTGVAAGTRVGGAGVGLRQGDLDEYAGGGGGGLGGGGSPGRDASPGRAVERARAARVPVGMGGGGKAGGAHGKPVFL